MQLGFLQNKSCLKLSLFCMRTDDWLNFHVKFQSIHVNITSTAHHFFFSPFFLLHISKTCQTQKNSKLVKLKKTPCQTQNKCLHTCNVYKYSEKIHFLHAFNSFQPEWLLNVTWNMRYMSRETCVTIQRTSEVEEVFQYYFGICPQHQKLTRINTCSWSMVFVWSWRKNFSFHSRMFQCHNFAGRLFYSQVDEPS